MEEHRDKVVIKFDRSGESGNIFYILGSVLRELKSAGRYYEYEEIYNRVYRSGSYDEALMIIGESVELVEESR